MEQDSESANNMEKTGQPAAEAMHLFPNEKPAKMSSNEQIMNVLFDKEDITWQTVMYELISTNQMDPWDIDISLLSKKFLAVLEAMKEMDLRIPAKMILAAAILLRIKSNKLVGEDLDALDQLIASSEDEEPQGLFDEDVDPRIRQLEIPELIPKTPQPRKRKVSIYDLVYALEKALEVKHRRVSASMPNTDIILPHKHKDISVIIKNMYVRIIDFFSAHNTHKVTFHTLVPASSSKEDKIYSFIPLMFLDHQKRVYLKQDKPFGDIDIYLRNEELIKEFEMEYEKEQEELNQKKKQRAKAKGKTTEAMKGDAKKLKQAKLEKKVSRKEQVEAGETVAKEHEKTEDLKEIYEETKEKDFDEPEPEEQVLDEEHDMAEGSLALTDEQIALIKEANKEIDVMKVGALEGEKAGVAEEAEQIPAQSVETEMDKEIGDELGKELGSELKDEQKNQDKDN